MGMGESGRKGEEDTIVIVSFGSAIETVKTQILVQC